MNSILPITKSNNSLIFLNEYAVYIYRRVLRQFQHRLSIQPLLGIRFTRESKMGLILRLRSAQVLRLRSAQVLRLRSAQAQRPTVL